MFRFDLIQDPVVIGRSPCCDLFVEDSMVSHEHARITITCDGYCITDLGSVNGTFVNLERFTQKILADGDYIMLGRTEMVFGKDSESPLHDALYGFTPAETAVGLPWSPQGASKSLMNRRCGACAHENFRWAAFCARCGRSFGGLAQRCLTRLRAMARRRAARRVGSRTCGECRLDFAGRRHARFCPRCGGNSLLH